MTRILNLICRLTMTHYSANKKVTDLCADTDTNVLMDSTGFLRISSQKSSATSRCCVWYLSVSSPSSHISWSVCWLPLASGPTSKQVSHNTCLSAPKSQKRYSGAYTSEPTSPVHFQGCNTWYLNSGGMFQLLVLVSCVVAAMLVFVFEIHFGQEISNCWDGRPFQSRVGRKVCVWGAAVFLSVGEAGSPI